VSPSIRRRLLAWLTAAILAAAAVQGAWQYRHALQQSDALFDYHLRQLALALRDQVLAAPSGATQLTRTEPDVVIQIWDAGGEHDYASHATVTLPRLATAGFGDVETPQGRWRVYAAPAGTRMIQVAQPHAMREEVAARSALRALAGPTALAVSLAALAWLAVTLGLRSVARLAGAVQAREPGDLRPVGTAGVPAEIVPLVRAFDELLARLAQSQAAQRALIADAAHALRSPLTALSLQLQSLEREGSVAADPESRARLRAGVERATRLVEQLLALARSEASADAITARHVRLDELARTTLATALPLADAHGTDLGLVRGEPVTVHGDPDALAALVANLVDNAIRHSGEAARVDVSAYAEDGRAVLEVADSGPGIPAGERARVLDRFQRGTAAGANGTGLGLAIVRAAVERHRGTLQLLDSPLGGLRVRVELPVAAP
jgi:two-component system OmpR family sensor kinase/two-component system sensor histidine kinase QseC